MFFPLGTVLDLDEKPIATVTHRTALLILIISGNHRERIHLYLIPSPSAGGISAPPTHSLTGHPAPPWAGAWPASTAHCLQSAISLSPEASGCPTALPDQFSVALLPLPSSQLYNLSHPERWEDTSLRRCIYYRALNEITKCNKYPLSLLDAAFAPLHKGASSPSWISATLTTLSASVMETSGKLPLTRPSVISSTCRWLTNAPAIFQALVKDMLHMALDATLSSSWGYHPQSNG